MTTVSSIQKTDALYPAGLINHLGPKAPHPIFALGNPDILYRKALALVCSIKCPGNLILKTYDFARQLRDAGVTVIGGFHSPMEKECLSLLLRGKQPVIWCLARRLTPKRPPRDYVEALSSGRLLILSCFGEKIKRATVETARIRNEFVAALSEKVFVSYAAPGGKIEVFCRRIISWGKPVFTLDSPENVALLTMGAHPYSSIHTMMEIPKEQPS